jgi:NitT/TauT family transport system substrate-binding protein
MNFRMIARSILPVIGLCALAVQPGRAEEMEAVTMTVPAVSLSFSLGYLAEDLGFFAKEGLAVKQLQVQGLAAINAVISGSAEFAEPSAASLNRAAAKGQRLLGIVSLTDKPFVQLIVRKEVAAAGRFDPKASLAQRALVLRGRTIAVDSVNSVVHAYVRLVARAGGYDPEDIKTAFMAPSSMIASLATKQIDGFAMTPPWPQKPLLDGTGTMIASGPDGDPDLSPFSNTVLLTRPDVCEKRPALCEKMGHAFAAAAAAIKNQPDVALAALQKRFSILDAKLMAVSFEVLRRITPVPPVLTAEALENVERYNLDAGLLKEDEKLKSFDGIFTDKYVR